MRRIKQSLFLQFLLTLLKSEIKLSDSIRLHCLAVKLIYAVAFVYLHSAGHNHIHTILRRKPHTHGILSKHHRAD